MNIQWYDICNDYSLEKLDTPPNVEGMEFCLDKVFGGTVFFEDEEEGPLFLKRVE